MCSIEVAKNLVIRGKPIPFNDICNIYLPTLDEIDKLDKDDGMGRYNYYVNLITMDMNDVKELLEKRGATLNFDIDIFDYLMLSAENDKQFFLDLRQALSTFTKEDIKIAPTSGKIIVGNIINQKVIDKDVFFDFQQIISAINKLPVKVRPPKDETAMQRKFRLKREERERIKAKGKKQKDGEEISFSSILTALCNYYPGSISLLNIGNYNIFQIKELLEKAQAREKYCSELDMLLAGADPKKVKPKFWY